MVKVYIYEKKMCTKLPWFRTENCSAGSDGRLAPLQHTSWKEFNFCERGDMLLPGHGSFTSPLCSKSELGVFLTAPAPAHKMFAMYFNWKLKAAGCREKFWKPDCATETRDKLKNPYFFVSTLWFWTRHRKASPGISGCWGLAMLQLCQTNPSNSNQSSLSPKQSDSTMGWKAGAHDF